MLADDHGDGVHNHTFPYITIIIKGGYWETLITWQILETSQDIFGFRSANIFIIELILKEGPRPLTIFLYWAHLD